VGERGDKTLDWNSGLLNDTTENEREVKKSRREVEVGRDEVRGFPGRLESEILLSGWFSGFLERDNFTLNLKPCGTVQTHICENNHKITISNRGRRLAPNTEECDASYHRNID
jgi:hypothetical protein